MKRKRKKTTISVFEMKYKDICEKRYNVYKAIKAAELAGDFEKADQLMLSFNFGIA